MTGHGDRIRRPATVLLGDPDLPDESKPGGRYTADDLRQVMSLRLALAGLEEYDFDVWDDHVVLLERLRTERPGFVVNFCDTGYANDARRELHVPALLELLGIPYSGSPPVALGACYDKGFVRAVAASIGIPVPAETYVESEADVPDGPWPAFVKPNRADGSVGITAESIAERREDAVRYVNWLLSERPGEAVLVQQLLPGRELSVGIIGNPGSPPGPAAAALRREPQSVWFTALPVLEVDYSALPPDLPHLLDYASKTDPDSPYWRDVKFSEARLAEPERLALVTRAARLFARLGLRDYARFDFRADPDGVVRLLEVNPNPAWCDDGKLAHMAGAAGTGHRELLHAIVETAWRRCRP